MTTAIVVIKKAQHCGTHHALTVAFPHTCTRLFNAQAVQYLNSHFREGEVPTAIIQQPCTWVLLFCMLYCIGCVCVCVCVALHLGLHFSYQISIITTSAKL